MKNISVFESCYGCGVCNTACSLNAIYMTYDKDGFIHPIVDEAKCIECQMCLKVCSFNDKALLDTYSLIHGYAGFSNDEVVRRMCSSGGVGYELSRLAMGLGYKVCVTRYDAENKCAEHYIASTVEELSQSCGSKYIQSKTTDAFSKFKRDDKFFVVGTPCQIDSLRRFIRLKKMDQNFILIDFFCHGVPSDLMWQKYVKEYGLQNSLEVKWRDKRKGWHDSWNMIFRNNECESSSLMSQGDIFYKFFLRNRCLGKACYDDCKYKMISSAADVRIGDLWGTKYQKDEKGVSGVVTLTQKGEALLHQLKSCTIIPESIEVVTESQMKHCPKQPSSYSYVTEALKSDASLREIDKKASRIEFFYDIIPQNIKYYGKRIVERLLCK